MGTFDASTAATESTTGPGQMIGSFGDEWRVGPAINGGVVMTFAARAMARTLGSGRSLDPLAVTASYLSASLPGPVTARTDIARLGGSLSTASVTVEQTGPDGSPAARVIAQGMFGDLAALPDDSGPQRRPPEDMPALEDCVPSTEAPAEFLATVPMLRQLDARYDPTTMAWMLGAPSGRGMIQAWMRFADGREPDPWSLLYMVDALPPVMADLGRWGWAPTLQLSAYVRAQPAAGWLLVRHETEQVSGGQFSEDVRIWDSTGALVAEGRQLARTPRKDFAAT